MRAITAFLISILFVFIFKWIIINYPDQTMIGFGIFLILAGVALIICGIMIIIME